MAQHGRRRAYGQHFLRDRSIAERIAQEAIDQAERNSCRSILEIGPGQGAITDPLIERTPQHIALVVCEKDSRLASRWAERPRIQFEHSDFLELPENRWLERAPITVVSNLPYSVGTAILDRLARQHEHIPSMVLMFQAEVAARLRAKSRTKDWGSLSVWIQNRWDVEKLLAVPPGAFSPPPEVQSEVVLLTRREIPRISIANEPLWERLLKACFAHRRKMLRSGLTGTLRNALDASGLDGTKRAEALEWDEWKKLYQAAASLSS